MIVNYGRMASINQSYNVLLPDIQEMEAYRLKKRRVIKLNLWVFLFLLACALFITILDYIKQIFPPNDKGFILAAIFFSLFIEGVVALIIYAANKSRYEKFFKENIVEKIVPALIPGVTYKYDDYIPIEIFRKSGLFNKRIGDYLTGQDHFFGKTAGMAFELSWLNNYSKTKKTYREYEGKTSVRYQKSDVFTGIFMIAKLPDHVESPIYIFPTFQEIGKLIKGLASSLNVITKPDAPEVKIKKSLLDPSAVQEIFKDLLRFLHMLSVFVKNYSSLRV